jgi:undecaprenyl-phosphate galactose phosphotransferase
MIGIGLLSLFYEGLYTKRLPVWRETKRLVRAATLAFFLMLGIVYLDKLSGEVSRTVLVLGYLASLILLPLGRLAGKTALVKTGLWDKPILILGAGKTGELVAGALLREKLMGYRIAGFLDDDPAKRARGVQVNGISFPVIGSFRDSNRVIAQNGIRHLIIAAPGMQAHKLVTLVNSLQRQAASVMVIPDLFGMPVMSAEADYFFDEQVLSFRIRNNLASVWNMLAKRAFDLVVGGFVLIAVLPLLAAIALAVKLDSPGPVIFAHRRIGRGRKEFECYKFRTMVVKAHQVLDELLRNNSALREEWEQDFKLKNDPRVTRVGRFLRRTSLDELPQIFNVLKGEMSLVGPRPIVQKEIPRFGLFTKDYFIVRPGITGLWQVSGRNDMDYPERVQLESWYVRNWSLWLDITLLIRTVGVVLARRGAY